MGVHMTEKASIRPIDTIWADVVHLIDPVNRIAQGACGMTIGLVLDHINPISGCQQKVNATNVPREVTCRRCLRLLGRETLQ